MTSPNSKFNIKRKTMVALSIVACNSGPIDLEWKAAPTDQIVYRIQIGICGQYNVWNIFLVIIHVVVQFKLQAGLGNLIMKSKGGRQMGAPDFFERVHRSCVETDLLDPLWPTNHG